MSSSFFIHFIISSLAASVVILLILLVKKTFKKHISARWQYNIDFIFLILLAVPFIPSSFFDFLNTGNWLNILYSREKTAASANVAVRRGAELVYDSNWLEDFSLSVNRSPEYLIDILMVIWIVGIISFAILALSGNRHLRLIKESMKPVEKPEILSLFSQKAVNGWFVGYVENNDHIVFFATNIQGKDGIGGSTAAQITLSILEDKGIY